MPSAMTTIIRLFFSCRPSTIFGRIRTVIVDTFKCSACKWYWCHISAKINETVAPSFANGNASASVIFPSWIVGIVATGLHSGPNMMEWAGAFTMFKGSWPDKFMAKTTTRARFISCQSVRSYNSLCSAVAMTQPSSLVALCAGRRNYSPASKSLSANQFNGSGHALELNNDCGGFMTAMGVPLIG